MKKINISHLMEAIRIDLSHINLVMAENKEYKSSEDDDVSSVSRVSRIDEEADEVTGSNANMSKEVLFAEFQNLGGIKVGKKLMDALKQIKGFIDLEKSNHDLIKKKSNKNDKSDKRDGILTYLIDIEGSILNFLEIIDQLISKNQSEKFNIHKLFNVNSLNDFYYLINEKIEVILGNIRKESESLVMISKNLRTDLIPAPSVEPSLDAKHNPNGKYNIYISIFKKLVSPFLVVEFIKGLGNKDLKFNDIKERFILFLNKKNQDFSSMVDDFNSRVSTVKALNPGQKYIEKIENCQVDLNNKRIEIESLISEKIKNIRLTPEPLREEKVLSSSVVSPVAEKSKSSESVPEKKELEIKEKDSENPLDVIFRQGCELLNSITFTYNHEDYKDDRRLLGSLQDKCLSFLQSFNNQLHGGHGGNDLTAQKEKFQNLALDFNDIILKRQKTIITLQRKAMDGLRRYIDQGESQRPCLSFLFKNTSNKLTMAKHLKDIVSNTGVKNIDPVNFKTMVNDPALGKIIKDLDRVHLLPSNLKKNLKDIVEDNDRFREVLAKIF